MENNLKFNTTESNKWFVVSDLHYCHNLLVDKRGFSDLSEYNASIVNNWNNTVSCNDTVFMLGDLVLGAGNRSREVYEELLYRLNYKELYLMSGNHWAGGHILFEESYEKGKIDKFNRLQVGFLDRDAFFIPSYYEVVVNNQGMILSHYPIISWNKQAKGWWHLHGHSHQSLHKHEWLEKNYYKGKVLDVSWELHQRPIEFQELKQIFDQREIVTFDHHV